MWLSTVAASEVGGIIGRCRPVECEDTLYIASRAYRATTGEELPGRVFGIAHPELDPEWDFDFDDGAEMDRRLPRLAALFPDY